MKVESAVFKEEIEIQHREELSAPKKCQWEQDNSLLLFTASVGAKCRDQIGSCRLLLTHKVVLYKCKLEFFPTRKLTVLSSAVLSPTVCPAVTVLLLCSSCGQASVSIVPLLPFLPWDSRLQNVTSYPSS